MLQPKVAIAGRRSLLLCQEKEGNPTAGMALTSVAPTSAGTRTQAAFLAAKQTGLLTARIGHEAERSSLDLREKTAGGQCCREELPDTHYVPSWQVSQL